MRKQILRVTGNNPLILPVIGFLLFLVSRAIVGGSYPLLAIILVTISFILVMIYKPDQLVNVYICTTFFLLLYRYFNRSVPVFALDSVKDYFLIWLWIFLLYQTLLNRETTETFQWKTAGHNIISLLFFIYIFLQIFRASEMRVGVFGFRKTAEFLTVFWFAQGFYDRKERITGLEKTLIRVIIITALIGIAQKVSGHYIDLRRTITLGEVSFKRATSTYGNPNTFADILLTGFILIFNRYLFVEIPRRKNIYLLPAVAILGLALLFTYSVSGFLAIISSLAFLFLLHRRNFKKKVLLGAFLGLVLVVVTVFTPLYSARLSRLEAKIGQPDTYDQLSRYVFWNECITLWKQSPIFGIGYGKVGGRLHWRTTDIPIIVDNSYIIIITQYGLVGIGLFVILLALIFRQAYLNRRRLQDH